ncbi:uncharacterized protein BX664DRAFT_388823 [Halteromyces radiatus]|uniref:uncharacterized protein n=1 Tax=Halteromyces radiatus TaxID=101107 RepID=UPI00221F1DC8|nr:uncharacterized protein BX664DRAFT_388823 [Halteromyces radiatus]KAI8079850.1 hypothetical protein BX664DRAFT_388823 [Halteromyces radiatus]
MTLIEEDDISSIYYSCDEDEEESLQIDDIDFSDDQGPFDIILVDIRKTAEQGRVYCEKMEILGEQTVDYIALSYRWGELDEQYVPATDDYYAHVISFHLYDFYALCRRMLHEPDLKDVKYVWVDAICVDQGNDQRKKATIYRMTDIYKNATYIVAVPDLHKYSLITISDSNERMYEQVHKHRWYIYHFIHENIQQLHRLDEDWRYRLKNPSDDTRQEYKKKLKVGRFLLDSEDKEIEAWDILSKQNHNDDHNLQHWITMYRTITEKLLEENRQERIKDVIYYLEGLFRDWSNRAWVISEYSIAKEQNKGKMKYWFIHLDKEDDFYGEPFFTLNFNRSDELYPDIPDYWYFRVLGDYHNSIMSNTVKRTFLDMMLNSRATKNEDRFHAILPLSSKYDKIKRSKDTISSWNISDMKSVKLKLYEILDMEDKLYLLQGCSKEIQTLLPTFVSKFDPDTIHYFTYVSSLRSSEFNFDFSDAIQFESNSKCGDYQGPCLHLRPKKYYIHPMDSLLQEEVKEYNRVLKELGFERMDESFKFATISSFYADDDSDITDLYEDLVIQLFGSITKNVWILCSFDMDDERLSRQVHVNKDYVFSVY